MARMQRSSGGKQEPSEVKKVIPKRRNKLGVMKVYDPIRFPNAAKVLCKEHGFTRTQLSQVFGVTRSVIHAWERDHEDFAIAIQEGTDAFANEKVEKTLLKTALGYEVEETSTTIGEKSTSVTKTTKHIQPNIKALTFWLTNRRKDRWANETTVNAKVSGSVSHTNRNLKITADLSKMNVEQLKALRNMIAIQQGDDSSPQNIAQQDIMPLIEHANNMSEAELITL